MQEVFERTKQLLASPSVVGYYDPELPTTILSDASNLNGLGYALIQHKDERPILIQCGSRSLSDAETRYAPVELECLGISWAIQKCRHYLLGNPGFHVVTDHNPLVGIFKKDIGDIDNRRLQRYREQLLPYVFDISWTAGKKHQIADAFSRNPVDEPDNLASTVKYVASIPRSISAKVLEAADSDRKYQQTITAIISRAKINDLPPAHPANEFKSFWSLLSVSSDNRLIIYDGSKVVVPSDARRHVIEFLHSAHACLLYTSPSPRDKRQSRMPSSA